MERLLDFLIIGAKKSGTASAKHHLNQHPDLFLHRELHFFDKDENYNKGIDWYHKQFTAASIQNCRVIGEKTPRYMVFPKSIDRIYQYNPKIKLIAFLREPVARTYSHWNFSRRYNRVFKSSYSEAVQQNRDMIVTRGHYMDQIDYILTKFPREQLHIAISEEVLENPNREYNRIFEFLGLSNHFITFSHGINQSPSYPKLSDTFPEQLEFLSQHYKTHNGRLYQFLGRQVWEPAQKKAILCYGLMRSGNHAVIFWLMRSLANKPAQIELLEKITLYQTNDHDTLLVNNIIWPERVELEEKESKNLPTLPWVKNIVSSNRDLFRNRAIAHRANQFTNLIFSFEELYSDCPPAQLERLSTESRQIFKVFILRDFFNFFASRKKWKLKFHHNCSLPFCLSRWMIFYQALENQITRDRAIGDINLVTINYNRWVSSQSYRESVGENFGLNKEHLADTDYVSDVGRGSSFIKANKEANADSYLTRYRQVPWVQSEVTQILGYPNLISIQRQEFGDQLVDQVIGYWTELGLDVGKS